MNTSSLLIGPPQNEEEIKEIKELNNVFENNNIKIVTPNGYEMQIPFQIIPILRAMVETLKNGNAITIIPMHKELTTQQAADILNVSRPYLIKLLDKGEIPFNKVGKHRRIAMQDLIEYKNKRDKVRKENLDELIRMSQEFGFYD